MHRYLGAVILILISVMVSLFYPKNSMLVEQASQSSEIQLPSSGDSDEHTVKWSILQKLDYQKNEVQDETLKQILNQNVRIPGFAVPLTDNLQAVSEFLFVPNQMACIHVPAPPPHLIVYVRLEKAMKIEDLIGPLWIRGTLRLKTMQSMYGASSYQMDGARVKPYEF